MYDFLLFSHVLSAFALSTMTVMYSSFALGGPTPPRALTTAQILDGAGGIGTLVFGVWLALYVNSYEIWDGWILAAIVLWAAAAETGRRAHAALTADGVGLATAAMVRWHWIRAALIVALLADMVWKPGA